MEPAQSHGDISSDCSELGFIVKGVPSEFRCNSFPKHILQTFSAYTEGLLFAV